LISSPISTVAPAPDACLFNDALINEDDEVETLEESLVVPRSSSPMCTVVNKRFCPVLVRIGRGAETPEIRHKTLISDANGPELDPYSASAIVNKGMLTQISIQNFSCLVKDRQTVAEPLFDFKHNKTFIIHHLPPHRRMGR
jgi:hypothetical protein